MPKEIVHCCVCNYGFWTMPLLKENRQLLKRNGKYICKPCYQEYLAMLAFKGETLKGEEDGQNSL